MKLFLINIIFQFFMSIKRSLEELENKYAEFTNTELLLDNLYNSLLNSKIIISNNTIINNIKYPLKKFKKNNESDNTNSEIIYTGTILGVNVFKFKRLKINNNNFYSFEDIKLIKENQIKVIEFINYEKIINKLIGYYFILKLLIINNNNINNIINNFLDNDINNQQKLLINFHKTLDIHNKLSKRNNNKLNLVFINKLVLLYSEYLLYQYN